MFREFSADLELAATIFDQLQNNWDLYNSRLQTTHPQSSTQAILQRTIDGIRDSLQQLSDHLQQHASVSQGLRHIRANLAFTRELNQSRQRLQMHLSSLNLVVQSLQLTQSQRTNQVLERIEAAQQEEQEESIEQTLIDGLANFEAQHVRRTPPSTVAMSVATTTSTESRDALIYRWRQDLRANISSHISTPTVEDEEQTRGTPPTYEVGERMGQGPPAFQNEARIGQQPFAYFTARAVAPVTVHQEPTLGFIFWSITSIAGAFSLVEIILSAASLSISSCCTT